MREALVFIKEPDNTRGSAWIRAEDTGVSPKDAELVVAQTYGDHPADLDQVRLSRTFETYVDLGILKPTPEPSCDSLVVTPQS